MRIRDVAICRAIRPRARVQCASAKAKKKQVRKEKLNRIVYVHNECTWIKHLSRHRDHSTIGRRKMKKKSRTKRKKRKTNRSTTFDVSESNDRDFLTFNLNDQTADSFSSFFIVVAAQKYFCDSLYFSFGMFRRPMNENRRQRFFLLRANILFALGIDVGCWRMSFFSAVTVKRNLFQFYFIFLHRFRFSFQFTRHHRRLWSTHLNACPFRSKTSCNYTTVLRSIHINYGYLSISNDPTCWRHIVLSAREKNKNNQSDDKTINQSQPQNDATVRSRTTWKDERTELIWQRQRNHFRLKSNELLAGNKVISFRTARRKVCAVMW